MTGLAAPARVKEGFTAETNNLKLASTPALGSEPSPTMVSKQTNGKAELRVALSPPGPGRTSGSLRSRMQTTPCESSWSGRRSR